MATELGSAYISVGLGTNTLAGDIKKAFNGAESSGSNAGKSAGKGFGLGFVGIASAAVGALGIGTFLKGAVSEASGLGESINAVNVVFGKAAGGVQKLGQESAKSLGLSNLEFNNLAVRFSSFADTIAGPGGDVTATLKSMTGRASDFASVMNLDVAEAAELFQSGLAGETEPLRAFGIDMSAAAVEAYALKNGIATTAGSMTEAQKVQARYGLLMQSTAKTHGDFANTSDSLANQTRILSSSWKNTQATLGGLFLPVLEKVVGFITANVMPSVDKLVASLGSGGLEGAFAPIAAVAGPIFATLASTFGPLIPQVLGLVSAFSPLGLLFQVITPILPLLAAAFTQISGSIAGVLAVVIPLVTQIVSALVPIIVQLVSTVLPPLALIFGELIAAIAPFIVQLASDLIPIINALMPVVVTVFSVVAEVIRNAMQIVQGIIQVVTGIISGDWSRVWQGIGNIFGGVWNTIVALVGGAIRIVGSVISAGLGAVGSFIGSVLGNIGRFFSDTWANVISGVSGFIGNFMGYINGLPGKIMGALSGAGSWLVSVGRNIIQGLIDGARGMIDQAVAAVKNVGGAMLDGIKGFLGIKSPSRVFKTQVGMMIGAGLIAGVDSTKKAVTSSVNSLVNIPQVPGISAGSYTAASFGGRATGGGVTFNGDIHVRDEDEMARIIQNKQMNAQAAYGF